VTPEPGGWLHRLAESAPAAWIRGSLWAYPAVEILHILGFVILVGAAVLFDLRLLGISRNTIPVRNLARHLLPFSRMSLLLVVPTGFLLFTTQPVELAGNPVFRVKLLLIALAGLNAFVFHRGVFRGASTWDLGVTTPPAARAAAVISLLLWATVVSCGRLLAYT
jgi:hypothetical protein